MRASGEHWFMCDVGNIYSMRFHYAGICFLCITDYTYSMRFHYAGIWFDVRCSLYIQHEVHAACQHQERCLAGATVPLSG